MGTGVGILTTGQESTNSSPPRKAASGQLALPSGPLSPTFLPTPSFHSSKNFHRFACYSPRNAHTENISLKTAPTGPRLGPFLFRSPAPCRQPSHPSRCPFARSTRRLQPIGLPPLPPKFICTFPQKPCTKIVPPSPTNSVRVNSVPALLAARPFAEAAD